MSYKRFSILLLLQIFLFIQCTTAETSDTKESKSNSDVANNFIDTENINNTINTATNSNKSEVTGKTKESIKQGSFKQIEFGFNIGYLGDLQQADLYKRVLSQIKQDGITNLRIYEPFTKNIIQKPGLAANLLTPLTQAGFKILLCLSNFPDISSIHYKKAEDDADKDNMSRYTNRRAPENIDAYQSFLTGFLDNLQNKNLLQNVSFEIGNEPDAKKYFWGQSADFIKVAKSVKQSLAKYGKPVYCCGFTSNFANKGSSKSPDYYNFLNDNSFFDNVNLSFHFYKDNIPDVTQIRLPRLNNAIITEFNLYSAQKANSTVKNQTTNSPEFGSVLIKALVFTYKNNIKQIYLFRLADTQDKESTFGFFDKNGDAKPSYEYFKYIFNVVKDGYNVNTTNSYISIIGKQQTIFYATGDNVTIPNNQVITSSIKSDVKNLNKNQWVIVKN